MPRKPKKLKQLIHETGDKEIAKLPDDLSPKIQKGCVIEPPSSISLPETIAQWKLVTRQLIDTELISPADLPTLEQAFAHLDGFRHAVKAIEKLRKDIPDSTDQARIEKENKLSLMMTRNISSYNNIMYRFGITPVERTRIAFNLDENEEKDALNAIIGE